MQSLLQVRGLSVSYCSDHCRPTVAVDDLSFDVAESEAVGLFGESGCGKTTLGLTLLGLLPRTGYVRAGSIRLMQIDLLCLRERQLQKIRGARMSMVHQEPGMALNPVLRVGDQIAEVLRAHTPLSMDRAKQEARALLAQVGLAADSGISEAYPHQLSGGQKQRVVIAEAIACRPAILIADEPTTALDAATQSEIVTLLKTLQTKLHMALLLISHDPGALEQTVDRILVMYAGRLVEEGSAQDVLQRPLHPYTRGLLRARLPEVEEANHKRFLSLIPGEAPAPTQMLAGCAFEPRCPEGRSLCRSRRPDEAQREESRRVACFNYVH